MNSLDGEFVFDDRPFLVDNPKLGQTHSLAWFFRENLWFYSNIEGAFSASYRPLFFLTLWSLDTIGLGGPLALHGFSLGLHLLASLLLLPLIRGLVPGAPAAAAALGAAVFAAHPVHSEAVAWVAAFPHSLAAVLLLSSCLCYLRNRTAAINRFDGAAVLFFALALLSNEIAVGLPFFLLALEWLTGHRAHLKRSLPFFAVLSLYALARRAVLGEFVPLNLGDPEAWNRLPVFLTEYLGQLVIAWPQPLYVEMPKTLAVSPGGWLGAALLLAAMAAMVRYLRESRRSLVLAGAWIATFLAAPLAATFNPDALLAVRSLYVPSIGLALVVPAILRSPLALRPVLTLALACPLLLGFVLLTAHANRQWENDGVVYARVIEWNPASHAGYLGLGRYLERQNDLAQAAALYQLAVQRAEAGDWLVAMEHLGIAQSMAGEYEKSLDTFNRMLRADAGNVSAWIGVGNNSWSLGDLEGALRAYQHAYESEPEGAVACYNLHLILVQLDRNAEAAGYSDCAAPQRPSPH